MKSIDYTVNLEDTEAVLESVKNLVALVKEEWEVDRIQIKVIGLSKPFRAPKGYILIFDIDIFEISSQRK